jgi:hypothetical protein
VRCGEEDLVQPLDHRRPGVASRRSGSASRPSAAAASHRCARSTTERR